MSENINNYKLVLGLEIHLHLRTATKMFCGCSADIYDAEPNTHTCPVCLGLPGALPVPNGEAVKKTQILGLALECHLNEKSRFDRKHYFYPDLPKGYQISQYKQPLCEGGELRLDSGEVAKLERIHLEEDTAKSFHENHKTLIDFNKGGMPLVEIVTTPCFHSVEDAVDFCKKIQDIVRFLDLGDVDMEKGQMRLEANISMRTLEMEERSELPKYKVEVKNINSFRFMAKAVKAEMIRQAEILAGGGEVKQENRGWNETTGTTVSQRDKEEAHDYRYFPEPDIPPMSFTKKYFDDLKKSLPELPEQRKLTLVNNYGLNDNLSRILSTSASSHLYNKFNEFVGKGLDASLTANYLVNKKGFADMNFEEFKTKLDEEKNKISSDMDLSPMIDSVLKRNPKAVEDYKKGKASSLEFLVGMVMRETRGKADANRVREELLIKM